MLTLGTHPEIVREADLSYHFREAQRVTYNTEFCRAFASAFVKLSILAFLWRLIIRLLAVFVVVWASVS